jgi:U8 snoRNA-decapping enzyme
MITQRIPFGQTNPNKKNAVFLAIYVDAISPWRYFKDDMQHLKCPALIMIELGWTDGISGGYGG